MIFPYGKKSFERKWKAYKKTGLHTNIAGAVEVMLTEEHNNDKVATYKYFLRMYNEINEIMGPKHEMTIFFHDCYNESKRLLEET